MPGSTRIPRAALVGDPWITAALAAYGVAKKGYAAYKGYKAAKGGAAPPPQSAFIGQPPSSMMDPRQLQAPQSVTLRRGQSATQVGRGLAQQSRTFGIQPSRIPALAGYVGAGERRRYRRMNCLNIRALKRALRRTKAFEKLARKVMRPSPFRQKIRGVRCAPKRKATA